MSLQLADSVVVVAARNFNVTIVNQLWLVNNHLLEAEDFQRGYVLTEMLVHVRARQCELLVTPEQLQCRPRVEPEQQIDLIRNKVGGFVTALPHTPYAAIGLNFTWMFIPEEAEARQLSRSFFFVPESPLHQAFNTPDARFGGYLSRSMFGGRLRLQANPSRCEVEGERRHCFILAFNFNRDIPQGQPEGVAIGVIHEMLEHWNEAREESAKIVQAIAQRDRR
jgi:hypothetical protein